MKEELYESSSEGEHDNEDGQSDNTNVVDVEDLGAIVGKMNEAKNSKIIQEPKEMITPLLRKALTKQGTPSALIYTVDCSQIKASM